MDFGRKKCCLRGVFFDLARFMPVRSIFGLSFAHVNIFVQKISKPVISLFIFSINNLLLKRTNIFFKLLSELRKQLKENIILKKVKSFRSKINTRKYEAN